MFPQQTLPFCTSRWLLGSGTIYRVKPLELVALLIDTVVKHDESTKDHKTAETPERIRRGKTYSSCFTNFFSSDSLTSFVSGAVFGRIEFRAHTFMILIQLPTCWALNFIL